MFGFTGLTVINPRIQFIRFAQFPNFAEVHRTEQTLPPSPPRDTEGLFFLCEKKHKTAFCDYVEEQNVTKPHFILTSPGTGWASSASFGTAAAALGHSPCGGCRWALAARESPGSHCCCFFRIRDTAPFLALLWNAQLSSKPRATEKNKHNLAFWLHFVL